MSQMGFFASGTGNSPIETLTGNTGGAVGPDGNGNVNVIGDINTISIAGNAGTNTLTASLASNVIGNRQFSGGSFTINSGVNDILISNDNADTLIQIAAPPLSGAKTIIMGSIFGASQIGLFYGSNGFQVSSAFSTTISGQPDGTINFTGQPAFSAFLSSTQSNATGDGTIFPIVFDIAFVNQGVSQYYNTSTGVFTAPTTGNYQFYAQVTMNGITDLTATSCRLVTSNGVFIDGTATVALNTIVFKISGMTTLAFGDTAHIDVQTVDTGGKIDDVFGHATIAYTFFYGSMIS